LKFGEKLIQAGLIDRAQLDAALSHQAQTSQMLGEALMELGYIGEADFLKFLAKQFSTQYVSTRKLSRAKIAQELLKVVPLKFAEQRLMFPILSGKGGKTLGVITCEPQNDEAIDEVRIVSGFEEIQVFVAHRDAIRAMIRKHYRGDINAFDMLEDANRIDSEAEKAISTASIQIEEDTRPGKKGPIVADLDDHEARISHVTSSWTKAIEQVRDSSLVSDNDFIETLNILVGLVEMQLPNRQGHSARVARMTKVVSERMKLDERATNHNITSAYLHDLGKRASLHLTLLSIGASKEHRHHAKRYHLTPSRLFDSVHLPRSVNNILSHLYENYDGTGLPEELSAVSIPLGARIIAAVDAFDDLVHNSNNLVGATLEPEQALARMKKEGGYLFDPHVLEALEQVTREDRNGESVVADQEVILLADADPGAVDELRAKLIAAGFGVREARDGQTAMDCLSNGRIVAAIVEVDLEPQDGFEILERTGSLRIPTFLMATDPLPEVITKAFKDGAVDFITKPFVADVVIAKLNKELSSQEDAAGSASSTSRAVTQPPPAEPADERESYPEIVDPETGITIEVEDDAVAAEDENLPAPSAVTISGVGGSKGNIISGSLDGKSALSLMRALSAKRRTGLLSLRLGEHKGEMYFQGGHIYQAIVGESQGEEAFLELASWKDCLYRFDPEQAPKSRVIKTPTGKLLQIAALSI